MESVEDIPKELLAKVKTMPLNSAGLDSRFPTHNQSNHCWNVFNEWVLCVKQSEDEDAVECAKARAKAESLCPEDWTEKWDEEREEGSFTGL